MTETADSSVVAQRTLEVELPLPPERALALVEEAVEGWGGDWQSSTRGGRFELPVAAGLRYGFVDGTASVSSAGSERSRVELWIERAEYRLQFRATVVLALGALGGLLLVVMPFVPVLLDLLPLAGLLLLLAWFLVASQLRHRSVDDFAQWLEELAQEQLDEGGS